MKAADPGRERLLLGLVLAFAAGLFLLYLGAGSLWDVDEPRYAEAGREILTTGDPVTLHLNGAPWLGQPPLWIWLQATSGAVLGFSEWSARIWAAVFGAAGVYATYRLGREWFGPRSGLLSALVLATMLMYVVTSRLAVLDTAALTWMVLALWAGYRAYRGGRRVDYVRAALFLGLGVLTRGPGTVVLPVVTMLVFLAYRRSLGRLRDVPWLPAAGAFLAVSVPWYAAETARYGRAFLDAAVLGHVVPRVASPPGAHARTLVTDSAIVAIGAIPWTAFLPGAAGYHYLRRWQDGSLLCLLWAALAFVMVAAAGERLPADVLPLFPVAAIAVGRLWEEFLYEDAGRLRRTLGASFVLQIGVVVLLVGGAAEFATTRYPREFAAVRDFLLAPIGALVLGTGVSTVLFRMSRYTAAFLSLPAATAVFIGILYAGTLPAVETQKPMKPLASALAAHLHPGDRVTAYMIETPAALVFYAGHTVGQTGDPAALRREMCAPGRVFVVARRDDLAAVTGLPAGLQLVDSYGPYVVEMKPPQLACGAGS